MDDQRLCAVGVDVSLHLRQHIITAKKALTFIGTLVSMLQSLHIHLVLRGQQGLLHTIGYQLHHSVLKGLAKLLQVVSMLCLIHPIVITPRYGELEDVLVRKAGRNVGMLQHFEVVLCLCVYLT